MIVVKADFNTSVINDRINKIKVQIQELMAFKEKFFGCSSDCYPDFYRNDRPKEINRLVELARDHLAFRDSLQAELQAHIEMVSSELTSMDEAIGQYASPKLQSAVIKKK